MGWSMGCFVAGAALRMGLGEHNDRKRNVKRARDAPEEHLKLPEGQCLHIRSSAVAENGESLVRECLGRASCEGAAVEAEGDR